MINKIKDIPDGKELWLKVKRTKSGYDDDKGIRFTASGKSGDFIYLNDYNLIFTEEELKALTNDGMPKQGEIEFGDEVEVSLDGEKWYSRDDTTYQFTFISKAKDKYIISKANNIIDKFEKELYVDGIRFYKYCRKHTKKTELTLAEVEEKLGLEKGSLIIK